eukprot:GHVO01055072.1.p1 GENE.GHVO01055072.1~~GHVO01055072.1.p1  ORF type:complete len:433 (+),score=61.09 GHVO01055072.1:647-1945(+)
MSMNNAFAAMSLQTSLKIEDPDDEVHSTAIIDSSYADCTPSSTSGHISSKLKPIKDKTCLVCGDKALGYNFNAISCESCKAFFRRNAFKDIRGRCEGKCEVTVESRSYCKKCRLKKCLDVGMKRDLILNDTQRKQRRKKIQENRLRRKGIPVPDLPLDDEVDSKSSSSPGEASTQGIRLRENIDPAQTHVLASSVDPVSLEGMKDSHIEHMQEVMKAFQLSFDGPMERSPSGLPSSTDFLNMADTSIRRLVKMAKHLTMFRSFEQEDQIALLKGAVVEVLILRSAKMFDSNAMSWMVNKAGTQHQVAASTFQMGNEDSIAFFQQYMHFASSLIQVTQKDNIILMLMIVITVLSPDRVTSQNTNVVSEAQEVYADILHEYAKLRYPTDDRMFARILQKLTDIRNLNETHTRMLMHMKVDELEPLIVEIFDVSA